MPNDSIFREPPTPKPPKPPKKRSERSRLQKVAAAQRKQEKLAARHRRREAVNHVQKQALATLAEETFGPGGLTPARKEALAAVLVGPDAGPINITNAIQLKTLLNKARQKFLGHADRYLETHINVVEKAFEVGELDMAARHAEWAIDRLSDGEDRVTVPPQQTKTQTNSQPSNLQIGVQLGGMPQPQK